jgi:hypothetical protein
LRGKNNAFGIAIPGFVDILPRTFFGPVTETVTVTGTRIAANTYSLTIPTDSLSVYYRIKSITDADSYTSDTSAEPLGSYGFSVIRTGTAAGSHVFSTSNPAEFVNTVYQTLNVTVTEVGGSDAMKDFKVVLYTAPSIPDIQSYIDGPMVRNLGTDILVRAPFVCLVDVTLRVYHNTSVVPDIAEIEEAIFNVINGKNFDTKLTRSDLVRAISPIAGVLRIDLTETGFKLNGTVIDGLEVELTLTGDMLDIDSVSGILSGLSASTCVFATELDRINVTLEVDE